MWKHHAKKRQTNLPLYELLNLHWWMQHLGIALQIYKIFN